MEDLLVWELGSWLDLCFWVRRSILEWYGCNGVERKEVVVADVLSWLSWVWCLSSGTRMSQGRRLETHGIKCMPVCSTNCPWPATLCNHFQRILVRTMHIYSRPPSCGICQSYAEVRINCYHFATDLFSIQIPSCQQLAWSMILVLASILDPWKGDTLHWHSVMPPAQACQVLWACNVMLDTCCKGIDLSFGTPGLEWPEC